MICPIGFVGSVLCWRDNDAFVTNALASPSWTLLHVPWFACVTVHLLFGSRGVTLSAQVRACGVRGTVGAPATAAPSYKYRKWRTNTFNIRARIHALQISKKMAIMYMYHASLL